MQSVGEGTRGHGKAPNGAQIVDERQIRRAFVFAASSRMGGSVSSQSTTNGDSHLRPTDGRISMRPGSKVYSKPRNRWAGPGGSSSSQGTGPNSAPERMSDRNQTDGSPANPPLPRTFEDSLGATWTVREIAPGPMPPKLRQLLGEERRYGGWLLFLSDSGEKRRLAPVPSGWATVSQGELEALCMRARRVPPAPERRSLDFEPPDEPE